MKLAGSDENAKSTRRGHGSRDATIMVRTKSVGTNMFTVDHKLVVDQTFDAADILQLNANM